MIRNPLIYFSLILVQLLKLNSTPFELEQLPSLIFLVPDIYSLGFTGTGDTNTAVIKQALNEYKKLTSKPFFFHI